MSISTKLNLKALFNLSIGHASQNESEKKLVINSLSVQITLYLIPLNRLFSIAPSETTVKIKIAHHVINLNFNNFTMNRRNQLDLFADCLPQKMDVCQGIELACNYWLVQLVRRFYSRKCREIIGKIKTFYVQNTNFNK